MTRMWLVSYITVTVTELFLCRGVTTGRMKGTKVQTLSVFLLVVVHECSRTAIQDTLKPWCLGSYADLAYSSYCS